MQDKNLNSEQGEREGEAPSGSAGGGGDVSPYKMKDKIIEVLKTCYDPEIPVDIYELGLIYDITVDDTNTALIKMTLTSPNCPVAGSLPGEVQQKIKSIEGITDCQLELVWDPPWTPEKMSEVAKLQLNMF